MIAKQGWNILTKPHTLVAKLYKARYFPNSSFFESKIGNNPSYAWRGIWKARDILMNGCRWRIGNGANIKVMYDPWLRGLEGAWISSPQEQGVHNLHVNDLMVPNMKIWDKEKIKSLFPMHVVNRIMDIPLLDNMDDDKIVWVDNAYGEYNVKSGYKLCFNITGKGMHAAHREDWSSIWNILVPPKTKHLLWRISKGCFPTRARLQEKHVLCPIICPLCSCEDENDWHVMFSCTASLQAWQTAGLSDILARHVQQGMDIRSVLHNICRNEDKKVAGLFAMVAWVLWNNRNNKVWNDVMEPGRNLGFKAKQFWEEWFVVYNQQPRGHYREQQQHVGTWQKPPQGWFKCNVDAGFHNESSKTSSGWCLRDYRGRFIRAATTWRDGTCSIIEGESLALIEALHALEQQGITHVIVESDSKSVVDAIQHVRGGSSEFSFFISQINNILSCNPNFVVKFVKRQTNMVANTLVRAAISQPRRCTFDILPHCISTFLNNEMI